MDQAKGLEKASEALAAGNQPLESKKLAWENALEKFKTAKVAWEVVSQVAAKEAASSWTAERISEILSRLRKLSGSSKQEKAAAGKQKSDGLNQKVIRSLSIHES